MALSELYEIGKRSRNPLAGVTKAARRGGGGRSLVTPLDNDAETIQVERIDQDVIERGVEALPNAKVTVAAKTTKCMICRVQDSKYNCPSCNIAYCSLGCYRSKKHESCSKPFLQNSLKEELGARHNAAGNGEEEGPMVDEEERKAMMDVLRRMKSLGPEADQEELQDEHGEEGYDDDEASEDLDLDDASIDQLLSMLSPEERARFRAAVEDQDPSRARARALLEKVMQVQENDGTKMKPWWQQGVSVQPTAKALTQQAQELAQQPSRANTAKIEYNILAVLLAYAFVVRHLDVCSLQDLQVESRQGDEDGMPPLEPVNGREKDEDHMEEKESLTEVARAKLMQFAPFLAVRGEASRVLLDTAEQVTLSFAAAQVADEVTTEPAAKTLSFLYQDVQGIITSPRLVENDPSSITDRALLALSDMSSFLPPPSQKKLLFYAVYWLRLNRAQRDNLQEQITLEIKRLEVELQRAEDQERFEAANEAVQQQIVSY